MRPYGNIYALLIDISIICIAVVISVVLLIQHDGGKRVTVDDREERYHRDVDPAVDLIFGNPGAELFVVEYADLECPYCQEFHPRMKNVIRSDWGVSGRVAWVWRNGFHISRASVEKARALECVRRHGGTRARTKAWNFIEESLRGGVYESTYPTERYADIMERLDIDRDAVETCRKNNEVAAAMAAAARDVNELNITETPYLQFISGDGELLFESVGSLTGTQIETFISSILRHTTPEKR